MGPALGRRPLLGLRPAARHPLFCFGGSPPCFGGLRPNRGFPCGKPEEAPGRSSRIRDCPARPYPTPIASVGYRSGRLTFTSFFPPSAASLYAFVKSSRLIDATARHANAFFSVSDLPSLCPPLADRFSSRPNHLLRTTFYRPTRALSVLADSSDFRAIPVLFLGKVFP